MAKMTLMDILPGILGLAGGALSPKAGEAAGATLEMADQFKQRHRRQAMMDEEAARRTVSDDRAARQEARSLESFEWQKANRIYEEGERTRAAEERSRAINAFGTAKERLIKEGYPIPAEYENYLPDTEEQGQIAVGKIRQVQSDTPMSWEAAEKYSAELKARGEVMYAPVRTPEGVVVRKMLGGYPQSQRTGLPEGTTTLFSNAQAIETAQLGLDHAEEDVRNTTLEQYEAGRDGEVLRIGPPGTNAGLGQRAIDAAVITDTHAQDQAVETQQLRLMQAIKDFQTTGVLRPEALELFMQMNASSIGQGAGAPAAAQQKPNVRPEVVQGMVAKHSGR